MTPTKRHVPLRTCLICGTKGPKRAFTRIVSTPKDGVKIDTSGRLPGRGAYVCNDVQCAPVSLRRGRIESALRARMTDHDWEVVAMEINARGAERS